MLTVCLLVSLKKRSGMANNAVYRVEKTVVYENGKVLNECYSILFYQDQILNCMREELIELHQLISLALNDRKEVSDEQES